jgi:hypothetical protein
MHIPPSKQPDMINAGAYTYKSVSLVQPRGEPLPTGASWERKAFDDMIPAIFCRPVIKPKVVALPLVEIVLLDNQAGMSTAGVKAPAVRRNVLYSVSSQLPNLP